MHTIHFLLNMLMNPNQSDEVTIQSFTQNTKKFLSRSSYVTCKSSKGQCFHKAKKKKKQLSVVLQKWVKLELKKQEIEVNQEKINHISYDYNKEVTY